MVNPYSNHNLEWTVAAALEFIDESSKGDKPFYLHCCTTLVHGPDKSWSHSMDDELITGAGRVEEPVRPEGMATRMEILAELKKQGLNRDEGHAGYSWVDAGVGAILKKLKQLGIDDNTLVIFTADHGSNMKGTLYDIDGACVPFIARWPKGIKSGAKCEALVQSIDIAATAFDLAGAKVPATYKLDGRSMAPLFDGATPKEWRDHLYIELGFGRAVRSKDWKYIAVRYPQEQVEAIQKANPEKLPQLMAPLNRSGIGTRGAQNPNFYFEDALFFVTRDRLERKNLVADPEFRQQLEKMQALLVNDLKTFGRPFGELIPGGNAVGAGQVDKEAELVRKMKVEGKTVILPDGLGAGGKKKSSSKDKKQAERDKRRADQKK
jgi:arylsulfatase A-like enzyme